MKKDNSKSQMYHMDKNHNISSLFLSVFLFFTSLIFLFSIIKWNIGYGLIFLSLFLLLFSLAKIFRSLFLIKNLSKKSTIMRNERIDIYIYELWHKKYVGNFWIFFLFSFIWFYSFIFNIIFFYLKIDIIISFKKDWIFYVFFFLVFFISLISFLINKFFLNRFVSSNKKYMNKIGVTSSELKATTYSTKNDYKYFVYFIISFFFLFLPLFLLINKNFTEMLKSL